ncbi:DUF4336 domain-containing protein [Pyxidicoccus parkwayensis]|uniref:DUF4336 domain-containing protein n=1 Tax=Pyxidicoccus parkwayensis TaxID=2813578 RepID=A0ABX7NUM7_9BACT|nr:DUF4336 domain-containing protein [Pyxidicoccus parkwaysis]QSQ22605.1 DUF4336 domain-containing protein [Pyxidicoccus parkwaysis]
MLRPVSEDVHVLTVGFRMGLFEVGGRMTVIRLPDGGLWVHSPVRFSPEVRAEVDALGPVRFLVAPNLFHHLAVQDWAAAYPDAKVAAPAALRRKRPDLRIDLELGDAPDAGWAGVIDQAFIRGMPKVDEVLFFHRPSRTALVTDLAFNFHRADSWLLRAYLKLSGGWQRLATTLTARALMKDKAAVRASLDKVLAWDVERVVVCHGDVVEQGGKKALVDGFARL